METSRERVLKAINHVQPEITPVHIMGFEGADRWLEHFGVKDDASFAGETRFGPPVRAVPHTWALTAGKGLLSGGRSRLSPVSGTGYSGTVGDYRLASAKSVADIQRYPLAQPGRLDYEVARTTLSAVEKRARRCRRPLRDDAGRHKSGTGAESRSLAAAYLFAV